MRHRRPFGDGAVDVGGAEHRVHILPRQRQPRRDHQQRDVLGERLGDAGECVLDAGARLGREHAVALAALDAGVAVGQAHADALLPAQDGTDVERGAGLDQRVARIAGEKLGALALENFGDDGRAVHEVASLVARIASAADDDASSLAFSKYELYSTPPPASNSSGMTPDRTKTSGGPQSPRSGSPVLDHAMTPTWVCASRAANARADAAEGQALGSRGTMPPSVSSNACTTWRVCGGKAGHLRGSA